MSRLHTATAALTCLLNLNTILFNADAAFISSTRTTARRILISKGELHRDHGAFAGGGFFLAPTSDQFNSVGDERVEDYESNFGPCGHDYLPAADAGPISPQVLSRLTEEQIHFLIAKRVKCKSNRNYAEADRILSGLVAAGVHLHDGRKEWRADGQKSFGATHKSDRFYVRRGGQEQLSEDDIATVASMVEKRALAKRKKDFHVSDELTEALKANYGVKVNDKKREWSINKSKVYVPSPIASEDDPTHTMDEESKTCIQKRLTDRVVAQKSKDYATADLIRDELKDEFSIAIDDRTKEWKVVTSEDDAFVNDAQASQRSAFVRENEIATSSEKEAFISDAPASKRSSFVREEETRALEEEFETIFGNGFDVSENPPTEDDEEVEPESATTIASDEAVPAPMEKDAPEESHLSTLTVVSLREKLRKEGLPVSGRKAELIERLMKSPS